MELKKEVESKLEKQPANKLDIARFAEGFLQFRHEVVKNFNVLLSEIGKQTEKIEGEIQPKISELLEEQGKERDKLNELMHSVKADMEEKEMKINALTAKNKALSRRLTTLTIFLILPYLTAIAFLCWLYLQRAV